MKKEVLKQVAIIENQKAAGTYVKKTPEKSKAKAPFVKPKLFHQESQRRMWKK